MKVRRFKPISAFSGGQDPRNISSLTAYWDASNAANMTLTATRQVSQLNDLSGNNYHLTQATAGYQPYLSRSDNQENRAFDSTALGATYWKTLQSARSAATIPGPLGNCVGIIGDATSAQHGYFHDTDTLVNYIAPSIPLSISAYIHAGDKTWAYMDLRFRNSNGDMVNTVSAFFDVVNGAVGTVSAGATATIEAVLGHDGWFKTTLNATVGGSATVTRVYYAINAAPSNGTVNFVGDSATINTYIQGAHLRSPSADTTYIPTTTYPQYRGINGNTALVFDGVDDYMSVNTLATVFAGADKPISIITAVRHATAAGNQDYIMLEKTGAYDNERLGFYKNTSPYLGFLNKDATTAAKNLVGADAVTTSTSVMSAIFTGTAGNLYINGTRTGAADQDGDIGAKTTLDKCTIGAHYNPLGSFMNGHIAAIAVFNKALSSDERIGVENYFRLKFGI